MASTLARKGESGIGGGLTQTTKKEPQLVLRKPKEDRRPCTRRDGVIRFTDHFIDLFVGLLNTGTRVLRRMGIYGLHPQSLRASYNDSGTGFSLSTALERVFEACVGVSGSHRYRILVDVCPYVSKCPLQAKRTTELPGMRNRRDGEGVEEYDPSS